MTTREKVIEIIQGMSEPEIEAEYARLRQMSTGDEFEDALDALARISQRVNVSTDAAGLIRDERDWHAGRLS